MYPLSIVHFVIQTVNPKGNDPSSRGVTNLKSLSASYNRQMGLYIEKESAGLLSFFRSFNVASFQSVDTSLALWLLFNRQINFLYKPALSASTHTWSGIPSGLGTVFALRSNSRSATPCSSDDRIE